MLLRRFVDMGLDIVDQHDGLTVCADRRLRSIDVATLPYPGIATDYKPLIVTMLSVADGVGIVTENLYPGRFRYVEELQRLGADIRTDGHHAVVRGRPSLSGAPVRAPDIRAGAALVVAGLAADGETDDHRRPPHRPRLRRPGRPPRRPRRRHRPPLTTSFDVRRPARRRRSGRRLVDAAAWRSTRRLASHSRHDDHEHRADDQQDLVPSALVREHADSASGDRQDQQHVAGLVALELEVAGAGRR